MEGRAADRNSKEFCRQIVSAILTGGCAFLLASSALAGVSHSETNACSVLFSNSSQEAHHARGASTDNRAGEKPWYERTTFTAAAKPVSTPNFASPARMILTRYAGHENFHSGSVHSWISNGQTFTEEGGKLSIQHGRGDDDSMLAEQQDFSLNKMVETNYLTPAEAQVFKRMGTTFDPGQVNFLEIVHEATPAEIKKFYGTYPAQRRAGVHASPHEYTDNGRSTIKTAALWSVAGQVWTGERGPPSTKVLPWEKEEARQGQQLDREKYKIIWEWGRAARDPSHEIAPLYSANAILNYIELRAHQGSLKDAYVMFHSFSKGNTEFFLIDHPDSVYPNGWDNPADCLFLVSLEHMLKTYPPRVASEKVAALIRLSNGKINDLQALDILIANRLLRWEELDFATPGGLQQSPIILNDMSLGRLIQLEVGLRRFGLSEDEFQAVGEYLVTKINPVLYTHNSKGKYDNAADSVLTSHHYRERNAVEIHNLDPKLAAEHEIYPLAVLLSSYSYYVRGLAEHIGPMHGLNGEDAIAFAQRTLQERDIRFGVTTSDPLIAQKLKSLNPVEVTEQAGTTSEHGKGPDQDMLKAKPYWFKDNQIFFFTAGQLRALAWKNPELFASLEHAIGQGTWRSHYLLSQTDLF